MDEQERRALYEEAGLGGDIGENVVVTEYDVAEGERGEHRGTPLVSGTAEGRDVEVTGAVGIARGEKTTVKGVAAIATGDRTKLMGWAELVAARNDVRIEKGATAVALAGREVELKDHGYAGVVLAPRVEVKEGGRVLITAATAILGGLAIGLGWGALMLLGVSAMLRRR